jgi:hypothetical protein
MGQNAGDNSEPLEGLPVRKQNGGASVENSKDGVSESSVLVGS